MTEGFVPDATHGSVAVSSWMEGPPEKSVWTGLKLSGRARSEISAWRCNRCGFIEFYAAAAPDRGHEKAQQAQVLLVVALVLGALLLVLAGVLILR
jgi:hypothetical protein